MKLMMLRYNGDKMLLQLPDLSPICEDTSSDCRVMQNSKAAKLCNLSNDIIDIYSFQQKRFIVREYQYSVV